MRGVKGIGRARVITRFPGSQKNHHPALIPPAAALISRITAANIPARRESTKKEGGGKILILYPTSITYFITNPITYFIINPITYFIINPITYSFPSPYQSKNMDLPAKSANAQKIGNPRNPRPAAPGAPPAAYINKGFHAPARTAPPAAPLQTLINKGFHEFVQPGSRAVGRDPLFIWLGGKWGKSGLFTHAYGSENF